MSLRAHSWATPFRDAKGDVDKQYAFSFDAKKIATSLRELADAIESERVFVLKGETSERVQSDAWTEADISLTLSMRME